jgi:hypothetical protein
VLDREVLGDEPIMATMCGDQGLLGVKKDLLQDLMGVKDCLDHEFDEF